MHQTKAYWRLIAAAGVVGAFVASACVVTTSTDIDNSAGAGGSGTAGKGSSGAATAGAATAGAATGGSGTAGAAPAAGAGQVPYQCDTGESGAPGTPNDCSPQTPGDPCQECIQTSCCGQYEACSATDPGNQCGWGGPAEPDGAPRKGESYCMTLCIQDGLQMGGTDEAVFRECGNRCATPECMGLLGTQTSELVACQKEHCYTQCFSG